MEIVRPRFKVAADATRLQCVSVKSTVLYAVGTLLYIARRLYARTILLYTHDNDIAAYGNFAYVDIRTYEIRYVNKNIVHIEVAYINNKRHLITEST